MLSIFNRLIVFFGLSLAAGSVLAGDPDICEPFRDAHVDESLLASMLSAAEQGHLYRLHKDSSRVGFCVNSKLARIEGRFRDFRGGINLHRGDHGEGQTLVLIEADSLETDGALVNSLVKSEQFFDVEHYPEVLFVSNDFRWTGEDSAVLEGKLTMRGITRPVVFDVTLTPMEMAGGITGRVEVKATTTIDRAEFGMDRLENVVDGEVQLCMSVEAERYEPGSS